MGGMDALVIGPPAGLAGRVAAGLRRRGRSVLQAVPADVACGERIAWLLDEAGRPGLIVLFDRAPYLVAHELLAHTRADIVLVVEHRAAAAGAAPARSYAPWPIGRGLRVVSLGRAGRRWFPLGGGTATLSAERAAATVLRSCGAAAASCR
jgi:hypothetical protein